MSFINRVKALFFPERCPYCHEPVEPEEPACDRCKAKLLTPHKPIERGVYGCRMVSSLRYNDEVRRAIVNMKFHERPQFIPQFVQVMIEDIRTVFPDEQFDAVVYVPMYPDDERERGFNQSEEMAKLLSNQLGVPCCGALIKVKHTKKQHDLSGAERRHNLKNAFRLKKGVSVRGARILLIDDIITTGATLSECIRTLNKDAPAHIACATFACAAGDVNFDTSLDSY